jgi:hypothetical protein
MTNKIPNKLYLQIEDDYGNPQTERTHSEDEAVNGSDVLYVRDTVDQWQIIDDLKRQVGTLGAEVERYKAQVDDGITHELVFLRSQTKAQAQTIEDQKAQLIERDITLGNIWAALRDESLGNPLDKIRQIMAENEPQGF